MPEHLMHAGRMMHAVQLHTDSAVHVTEQCTAQVGSPASAWCRRVKDLPSAFHPIRIVLSTCVCAWVPALFIYYLFILVCVSSCVCVCVCVCARTCICLSV